MWVRITLTWKDWKNWGVLKGYLQWRWYSAIRAIKNPAQWWRRYKRVRQINKYLLAEARKYEQHG